MKFCNSILLLFTFGAIAYGQPSLTPRYKTCTTCDTTQTGNRVFYYGAATNYPIQLVADDYGARKLYIPVCLTP
jgi:hypothetical protein